MGKRKEGIYDYLKINTFSLKTIVVINDLKVKKRDSNFLSQSVNMNNIRGIITIITFYEQTMSSIPAYITLIIE